MSRWNNVVVLLESESCPPFKEYAFMAFAGTLIAFYDELKGVYTIDSLQTRTPRHQANELLLQACAQHAEAIGACAIEAPVTTREELLFMSRVFGVECLDMRSVGAYAAPDGRSAPRVNATEGYLYRPLSH